MDFVERQFHLSPEGGNGLTEAVWLGGTALTAPIACLWVCVGLTQMLSRCGERDE